MTNFLLSGGSHQQSRLLVSMVICYLQSLVPATPGNIGASFLRPLCMDLHNFSTDSTPNTKASYFIKMSLSERSKLCLQWWVDALTCGLSRQSQPLDVATLGVT